jgi:hypothetical protein
MHTTNNLKKPDMNILKFGRARVLSAHSSPPFPIARRRVPTALVLLSAALCAPSVGWAVPLLGAAQSFVVLEGSSFSQGVAGATTGVSGGSAGIGINANGGFSSAGSAQGSGGSFSAGSAPSAVGTSPATSNAPRAAATAQPDRPVEILAGTALSIPPCAALRADNSLTRAKSAPPVQCTAKAAELSELDIDHAIVTTP